jgi:hypothetical protein
MRNNSARGELYDQDTWQILLSAEETGDTIALLDIAGNGILRWVFEHEKKNSFESCNLGDACPTRI